MAAKKVVIAPGEEVTIEHGKLRVPDHPIIAYIGGDGTAIIQNMARL
jgi:isocitrate dehydrogenase